MRQSLICLVFVPLLSAATPFQASFESSNHGWSALRVAATPDGSIAYESHKSMRVEPSPSGDAAVRSAPITLTIGKRYELLWSICCGVSFGLRPNFTPRRCAASTPARVRSLIRPRSSSAKAFGRGSTGNPRKTQAQTTRRGHRLARSRSFEGRGDESELRLQLGDGVSLLVRSAPGKDFWGYWLPK
jgi:hypothetical protein